MFIENKIGLKVCYFPCDGSVGNESEKSRNKLLEEH